MKFIHAVIFDVDEYNELKEYGVDFENWDDITQGDYIVHCLFCEDTEDLIVLEDNTHAPVEQIISSFLDGVRFIYDEVIVKKAYIVVDNGLGYDKEAATLCLVEGAYREVID